MGQTLGTCCLGDRVSALPAPRAEVLALPREEEPLFRPRGSGESQHFQKH